MLEAIRLEVILLKISEWLVEAYYLVNGLLQVVVYWLFLM